MQRFQSYKKSFLSALKYSKQTGAGVNEEHKKKGILTFEQLLESLCPQFERMKAIFGEKPNVKPFAVFDSTKPDSIVSISLLF